VIARLHERGRIDAVGPLVKVAAERGGVAVWRALVHVLDTPAEVHGPAIAATLASTKERELAIRALGLAGGAPGTDLAAWRDDPDAAISLTAEVATLRLASDHEGALALLADAVRDSGSTARVAIDELGVEIARGSPGQPRSDARGRAPPGSRAAAPARRHGEPHDGVRALGRVVGWARDRRDAELSLLRADLLELARERVEAAATPIAPDTT